MDQIIVLEKEAACSLKQAALLIYVLLLFLYETETSLISRFL